MRFSRFISFLCRCLALSSSLGLAVSLTSCGGSTTIPSVASRGTATPAATPTEPALAPPRPTAYAALGASETYGVGATPHTKGYAYLVARSLNAQPYANEGIPGTTLGTAFDTELSGALPIRPHLCTVFFGFNDLSAGVSRPSFLSDLHDFALSLRREGAQVLIIGLPDLSLLPAAAHRFPNLHSTVTNWNAGMRTVALQTGSRFLDLHAFAAELAAHPGYISSDGLHPSNAGHARLAQVILSAIRRDGLWNLH